MIGRRHRVPDGLGEEREPPERAMMRFLRLLAWSFITAALVIAGGRRRGYWLYREAEAPGPLAEARTLVVPPHTGISGIAALLAEEGVIRHPLAFELMARLSARRRAEGRRVRVPGGGEPDADAGHPGRRQDGQAPADNSRGPDECRGRRRWCATRRRSTAMPARRRPRARCCRTPISTAMATAARS